MDALKTSGDFGDCRIHVWTQRGSRREPDIIYNLKASDGGHGGSDPNIVNAFFDFVRDGKPPVVSPVAARNAVAAGALAHCSMRNGNMPMGYSAGFVPNSWNILQTDRRKADSTAHTLQTT